MVLGGHKPVRFTAGPRPFPIRSSLSGNDGAFINETLIGYSAGHDLALTCSRGYRDNDQGRIDLAEERLGGLVRHFGSLAVSDWIPAPFVVNLQSGVLSVHPGWSPWYVICL